MNILFLSLANFFSIKDSRGIYQDLLRTFARNGHNIYAVCPRERRHHLPTQIINEENGMHLLYVHTGNITKVSNLFEKGISMLRIAGQYQSAIQNYLPKVRFDLVVYATPPNTWSGLVKYIKQRDKAKSYLLLKDILPDGAVNLGALNKSGIKGFAYRYFRKKEKKLYQVSDFIGCMSPANANYILRHNPEISTDCVEVCPNAIEIIDKSIDAAERDAIRRKYGIPMDKTVFVYGGNLGKPQGVDFICRCMEQIGGVDAYFLIVGDGAEYGTLERFMDKHRPRNARLMKRLPKDEYDTMIGACDVGLIFLDYRFTIPNFPSRLLSYMQAHLPVLACTDPNTDVGQVVVDGGFGWWCLSNSVDGFIATVEKAMQADRKEMGEKAWGYLKEHYDVEIAYKTIMSHFEKEQTLDV